MKFKLSLIFTLAFLSSGQVFGQLSDLFYWRTYSVNNPAYVNTEVKNQSNLGFAVDPEVGSSGMLLHNHTLVNKNTNLGANFNYYRLGGSIARERNFQARISHVIFDKLGTLNVGIAPTLKQQISSSGIQSPNPASEKQTSANIDVGYMFKHNGFTMAGSVVNLFDNDFQQRTNQFFSEYVIEGDKINLVFQGNYFRAKDTAPRIAARSRLIIDSKLSFTIGRVIDNSYEMAVSYLIKDRLELSYGLSAYDENSDNLRFGEHFINLSFKWDE